jgi:hypothetical protein
MLMANTNPKPRIAIGVSANQIRVLADQLSEWSETLRKIAETAESQPDTEIALFNWQSVPKGLQLIGSFITRAQDSRRQALLGQPLSPGQTMPTSRAAKIKTASEIDSKPDDVEELKGGLVNRLNKSTKPPEKQDRKRKAQ